ncbi:MAG: hypothetical protein F6K42_01730 [Leptolyngbya sp. SIO1D8]|nr:hypothetical protein [Leptolyngbya sp. SIO1D8]
MLALPLPLPAPAPALRSYSLIDRQNQEIKRLQGAEFAHQTQSEKGIQARSAARHQFLKQNILT